MLIKSHEIQDFNFGLKNCQILNNEFIYQNKA